MRSVRARMSWGLVLGVLIPLALAAAIALADANRSVFVALQSASRIVPQAIFASFWQSATYVGDGLAAVVIAALFLRHRNDVSLAIVIAAIPLVGAYTHALRALFPVDRPPHVLATQGITVLGPVLQFGSFPSGHAATAGALAGVVFFAYPRPAVRTLAVLGAMVVAMSRAAVGVHWPIDISVGFAGGWLCAWIAWQLAGGRAWTFRRPTRIVTSAILAGCALALAFHPMGLPGALALRWTLAVAGLASALVALGRAAGERAEAASFPS